MGRERRTHTAAGCRVQLVSLQQQSKTESPLSVSLARRLSCTHTDSRSPVRLGLICCDCCCTKDTAVRRAGDGDCGTHARLDLLLCSTGVRCVRARRALARVYCRASADVSNVYCVVYVVCRHHRRHVHVSHSLHRRFLRLTIPNNKIIKRY